MTDHKGAGDTIYLKDRIRKGGDGSGIWLVARGKVMSDRPFLTPPEFVLLNSWTSVLN